jgi:hypothetical protein
LRSFLHNFGKVAKRSVETATVDLIINSTTAMALGLANRESLLMHADEVIKQTFRSAITGSREVTLRVTPNLAASAAAWKPGKHQIGGTRFRETRPPEAPAAARAPRAAKRQPRR